MVRVAEHNRSLAISPNLVAAPIFAMSNEGADYGDEPWSPGRVEAGIHHLEVWANQAVLPVAKTQPVSSFNDAPNWVTTAPRLLTELDQEAAARHKASALIGAVAVGAWQPEQSAGLETNKPVIQSLHEAIQSAARGDKQGRKYAEASAGTDVLERTIKAGHVISAKVDIAADGSLWQNGQDDLTIQANSLRYGSTLPGMDQRTEAETRNSFRIKAALQAGLLEDNVILVASRAPDDMTQQQMKQAGFFTDTMSCSFQLISKSGNQLVIESAFVAGVKEPEMLRHDGQTIARLGAKLGLSLEGLSATELLDRPILLPKSFARNGVIDIAALYDECAGGNVFFGQRVPKQDYVTFREQCRKREQSYQTDIAAIVDELIAEAPTIKSAVEATVRLNKISGKRMIMRAATDLSIDSYVFGRAAAGHIEMARWHEQNGNYELARREQFRAIEQDQSSSCPGVAKPRNASSATETDEQLGVEKVSKSAEDGDCTFESDECPECHTKKVKTTVKKITATKKEVTGDCGCRRVYDIIEV